jgi:putative ABC transport system permease protein
MRINQLFRSLLRDRLNTSVVIISLAVGMTSFNLVIMFINRELGTDSFHEREGQIYALKCDDPWIPGKQIYYCKFGSAEYMKANFAQVEDYCRISNSGSQKILVNNEEYSDQPPIISASENFFSFFTYILSSGDWTTALESKYDVVISDNLAEKYFGSDNPMGKVIEIVNRDKTEKMIVSGVFKKPTENSQLTFEMVRRIGDSDSRCYIRLTSQFEKDETEKLLFDNRASIPVVNVGTPVPYYLEPLKDAYFDTTRGSSVEKSRKKSDLWIALVIGIMILSIAVFNYLGIISNRFLFKIKEFKIRQINGSKRSAIMFGFMAENAILISVSYLVSLYLMLELVPFFNSLTGSNITERFFFQPEQFTILLGVMALLVIVTLLFVSYLVNSEAKDNFFKVEHTRQIKSIQIPVLHIFQISSSIVLIICSIIIIRQMNFIKERPIGLDKNVIEVRIPSQFTDKAPIFKDELLKNSSINLISIVGASPLLEHFLVSLKYEQNGSEKQYVPAGFSGDENYLKVLGIKILEGDSFHEVQPGGTKNCVINKSFTKLFPGQHLIGKGMPGMEDMIITGIVEDFHYSSLKTWVEPAFISYSKKGSHLLVKPANNQTSQAMNAITQVWKEIIPDFPVNTESVGDRYNWYHRENENYLRLIVSCSLVSIFLSMIGLFTVSYQKSRSRTKEIGIRKINGASIISILGMLNRDVARWILLASVIAVPVTYFAMSSWLGNYAYKTEISWWLFAFGVTIVTVIAMFTVSWQSWRAATRNPVEALRYE